MRRHLIAALGSLLPLTASAAFMDAQWADQACKAWNDNATLTSELAAKGWVDNNNNRGYKLVQIYRSHCGDTTKIQLNLARDGERAVCNYGGAPDGKAFDKKYDYIMNATDEHWGCIGAGKFGCGAMGAMSTGKLKFTGPKMEAMSVMGPFGEFLLLTGKLGGDTSACP